MLVSSVISAIILSMTPAFPLNIPFKQRPDTSASSERERPKRRLETMVPRRPHRGTDLRPTLSERWLHWSTVTASAAKYWTSTDYAGELQKNGEVRLYEAGAL
ncbi:hypothetical protein EI94DRAFT_1753902 [Lactarius quietus]|nr:hypothetical protein EI94DRAFT_1753902 [Lactarius quietus]